MIGQRLLNQIHGGDVVHDITIKIRNKKAHLIEKSEIVCGNSDYVICFDFDAEWDAYNAKTLGMKFCRNGKKEIYEVLFSGDTCMLPPVYDVTQVEIGVCAGDIRTSTGAVIECVPCIMDGFPAHADPPEDVYNQLLQFLAGSQGSTVQTVSRVTPRLYGAEAEVGTAVEFHPYEEDTP